MTEKQETPKEKYTKIIQEFRSSKTLLNLQNIYKDLQENKSNLLDDNIIPFQFSNDLIWFLSNNIIDLEIQMNIFKLYIDSFFTFKLKPENLQKLTLFDQIFKYDSFLYKTTADTKDFECFIKKYFDKFFPKKKKLKIEKGVVMDVFIKEKDLMGDIFYGWTQIPVKRIENNYVIFNDYDDENKEFKFLMDSYEIQEKNRFISEEEMKWRNEIKRGDKVDFLNNMRLWVEADIINVLNNNVVLNPLGGVQGDNTIRSIYTPLIKPLHSFSFKYDETEMNYFPFLNFNSSFSKFNYCLPRPKVIEGHDGNFLIPNNILPYHCLLFYDILNYYINKLVQCKYFEDDNEENITIEYIYKILDILNKGFEILNQLFFGNYFNEIIFPKVKNILLKISLDKKKNISKIMVTRILEISQKFIEMNSYIFQQPKIVLEFTLKFGFNCFKESENLEKRLIGLNSILSGLRSLFFFQNNKIYNEYNILIYQILFSDDNNDLFSLLFNKSDIHEQLILKGADIVTDLYMKNILDSKDINKLYNYAISSQEGSEACTQLYSILTKICGNMSLDQSQNMINKIITIPLEQITRNDISLIFSIIEQIKTENNYKKTITEALDYIYEFIISDTIKGKNFISDFTKTIAFLRNDDNIFFASYYIEKIIKELLKKQNLRKTEFFYDFLSYFILSFNSDEVKKVMKGKFIEYLSQNNNSSKLLDNLLENIEINTEEITQEKKIDHIIAIIDSIKSILFYANYYYFFTTSSILKLCDFFLFTKKKIRKQNDFLRSLTFFKRNYLMNIDEFCEKFFKKFEIYISEINKENYLDYWEIIDDEYAEMVLRFYQTANYLEEDENSDGTITENCFIKKNPLELKYFDTVWKMFTKINEASLMEQFLADFSLRLFKPEERFSIWETIIKKIFDEIDSFIEPKTALNMVKNIVSNSEIFGTGGAVSHSLDKIKKFPLKLSIKSKIYPFQDFELTENIYTTSTIYDVKKEIQKKYSVDPIFIDFVKFNNTDFYSDNNGKNLCTVFCLQNISTSSLTSLTKEQLEKKYVLTMIKSREFNRMKKHRLLDDNNPTAFYDKVTALFKTIFEQASHGKDLMTKEDLHAYFVQTTGAQVTYEIEQDLKKFEYENTGGWNFDSFIRFYLNAFKENKIYAIFFNLNNLGYRNDLEFINKPLDTNCPLYYEENNNYKYMPRYFIGNNMEYMNKLFSFSASNDKSENELAQKIIKELSTMEQMKNFFGKKEENDKIIDDLLQNDNLEMRTYAFNIILSEFEKYNETDDQDIQSSLNSFIEKYLGKIIINFDSFIKNELSNNKNITNKENAKYIQFLNYYHIIIQIIIFCLKRLINDISLSEIIQKFDVEDKDKENTILNALSNIKIKEENKNILKSLKLEELFNIMISFLVFQKEQLKNVIYDLKFSFIIILLIFILLEQNIESDEVKQNIYKNYISNIVYLSKSPLVRCKKLFQNANEIILMIKKTDKNFGNLIKEETTNEVLKYELLNRPLLYQNYLSVIYKDIINILIGKNEDDDKFLFNLFKSLVEIISNKTIYLRELLITNYLEILSLVISKLKEINNKSIYEYDFNNLLSLLINNYLINTKNYSNKIYSKNNSPEYVGTLFALIEKIISVDPNKYIFSFFDNDEIKNLKTNHLSILPDDKLNYDPRTELKNKTNYLGLRNLSSLCYMNSVLQQLYMIPIFKKTILDLKINTNEYKLHEKEDVDDLLFQLVKMFYYLSYSDKSYYDPKNFVFSFKDYDGNPTNPNVQCDAQEFLTRFIEKVEESIKTTSGRFLCHNILGGTTIQQIICTNTDCRNISERKESIIYLSLDIKGNKTLDDCLEKFIREEKIEDFHCEKCDKKITHIKKVLIDKLPNILILYLQRIAFNYETFLMEKINDEIAFEKELNIKKYTFEKNNKNINKENYDYELIGVIIHSGTAQYGHYYSVIFSQDKKNDNKWYKFNDTSVTETTYEQMKKDVENNNNQNREYNPSPYLLLYQKKIKNPVLVNIRDINENENILNLLKDDKNINIEDKGINYEVYEDERDAIEKNIQNENNGKEVILKDKKLIGHLISYDYAVNYINKLNEDIKEENIPFKSIILDENIKFCNDKKIYSSPFEYFISNIIKEIKKEIEKNNNLSEKYFPILKTINYYLFNIFSISWYKDDLNDIIENLISLLKYTNFAAYFIKDIFEPKKEILFHDYLVCKDAKLGKAFSNYLAKILVSSIENNIENETSLQIVNYYMNKIPVEISKKWSEMEYFNNFILILVENSEKIKKKFLSEEIISKLIDFILGKSSPLYKGDERNENKNTKGKLGPLVRSIAYLYQYYINNKEKDETLKISEQDKTMIDYMPFYEYIILDDYDEIGSSILINLKLDLSLNINDPNNINNLDLIAKLKIPSSKSVEGIISCLSLIEKILNSCKEEKYKIELLNILIGIPTIVVEKEEAKILYISGGWFNYYTILTNIVNKNDIDINTIPLLLNTFKFLYKYPEVNEYLSKLPAPNSYTYTYKEYLIRFYIESINYIENMDIINKSTDIDKFNKLYEELKLVMDDYCKKYNINLEDIKNNEEICIKNHMYVNYVRYDRLDKINLKNITNLNYLSNYENKIKVFHITFDYNLFKELEKTHCRFFDEKGDITASHCSDSSRQIGNSKEYSLEGIFILGIQNCKFSFSLEPIINTNMEISIKRFEKYILFIKKFDPPNKEYKSLNNDCDIYFDLNKLTIKEIENDKNKEELNLSETNKIQANENAFVINCPMCTTPNFIDENNQTFQCYACSAILL